MNANETNRLAIARAHFFGIAFSYPAQFQIVESPYSVPSNIFILYYFQMDLTDGLVMCVYIYIYIYISRFGNLNESHQTMQSRIIFILISLNTYLQYQI